MICKVCGRNIANDSANFCEYCGASLREADQSVNLNQGQANGYQQTMYQQAYPTGQPYPMYQDPSNEELERPVSFKNWLLSMLLQLIPIVYIVMLFVWAFDKDTPKSKRNWARATLIVAAIGVVIAIIFIAAIFSVAGSSGISLQDLSNPTYY